MSLADRSILLAPVHYYTGADVGGTELGWAYHYVGIAAQLFGHVDAIMGELRNGAFSPNVSVHQVLPVTKQHLFSTPTVLSFLSRYSARGLSLARRKPDILHHVFPWSPSTFNPLVLSRGWPFGIDRRTRVVMGPLTPSHAIDFEEDYPTSIARRSFGDKREEGRTNRPPRPGSPLRRIAGALCMATLRRADAIFTVRDDIKEWLGAAGIRAPIVVIPPGVSFDRFSFVDRGGRSGTFRFLQSSMLIKRKGIDLTLRALALAIGHGADAMLTLVGDGPQREHIVELASQLGLGSRLEIAGFSSHEGLMRHYANADALVTMSWSEGLPPGVMEAMATGLPCISASNDGARAVLQPERTGLLVPLGDVEACAQAMQRLAGDRAYACALGRAANEDARARFDWRVIGEMIGRLYESVLERPPANTRGATAAR